MIEELYRSDQSSLLRSISRSAGSFEDAQDIVQEAFARIARMKDEAIRLERPRAFLRQVAVNLMRDRARTSARLRTHQHIPADEALLPPTDPVKHLESRDMLNRIEAAMMRLNPKTREIFMAHRIDGLSYSQIAERSGISIKGVEKQMSKALRHLDRLLDR